MKFHKIKWFNSQQAKSITLGVNVFPLNHCKKAVNKDQRLNATTILCNHQHYGLFWQICQSMTRRRKFKKLQINTIFLQLTLLPSLKVNMHSLWINVSSLPPCRTQSSILCFIAFEHIHIFRDYHYTLEEFFRYKINSNTWTIQNLMKYYADWIFLQVLFFRKILLLSLNRKNSVAKKNLYCVKVSTCRAPVLF